MTGPFVPVAMLNLIRALLGIHHHRFNLSVKRSRGVRPSRSLRDGAGGFWLGVPLGCCLGMWDRDYIRGPGPC